MLMAYQKALCIMECPDPLCRIRINRCSNRTWASMTTSRARWIRPKVEMGADVGQVLGIRSSTAELAVDAIPADSAGSR
jgi:hypothetical protein